MDAEMRIVSNCVIVQVFYLIFPSGRDKIEIT